MNHELLRQYNQELESLRQHGAAFAAAHPKIASRLKLGQGHVDDPLVGRILEATAFLTARMRQQLVANENELDENILQLLYPHYFLPIPASSTVVLKPAVELKEPYVIAAGTELSTPLSSKRNCYFRFAYPVTVRPITVSKLQYQRDASVAPKQHAPKLLKSCLSLTLTPNNAQVKLKQNLEGSVRFFINNDAVYSNRLYELLLTRIKEIVLVVNDKTISLPLSSIQTVGFSDREALLPYPENSFPGYRLLTEYFAYPEKFHYLDFNNLADHVDETATELEIHCFFDYYYPELKDKVDAETLLLNCTPIVNLFSRPADAVTVDHSQSEYHVIADTHADLSEIEIYSIQNVAAIVDEKTPPFDCAPYFGRKFEQQQAQYVYWHARRKPCWSLGHEHVVGDEVFLAVSDFNFTAEVSEVRLTPYLLCTNRNMPSQLPFGGGKPDWHFHQGAHESIAAIQCIKAITEARYRSHDRQRQQLAQHIYLNQVGVATANSTLSNLQLLLSHYDHKHAHAEHTLQNGLLAAACKALTVRHPSTLQQGFCRGLAYQLTIDESCFVDNESYLFGSVLQHFLTKSCSMNGFTQLHIESKQRGQLFTWQPLLGTKPLL